MRMQPLAAFEAPASCRRLSLNSPPPAGPLLGIKTQHLAHQEETSNFSWGSCAVSGSNSLPQLEAPFLSLELGGFQFLQTHLCI